MANIGSAAFHDHFQDLQDPRVERTRKHPLINIVFIAVCGVLSGANSFAAIHEFGRRPQDLVRPLPRPDQRHPLRRHLRPRPGPARSRRRSRSACLSWIQAVQEVTDEPADRHRRQDAPRLRTTGGTARRRSTWSRPGRPRTSCRWARWSSTRSPTRSRRSPNCCELLDISGALVTIDAMGCQKEIADADPRAGRRLRPGGQAEPADAV